MSYEVYTDGSSINNGKDCQQAGAASSVYNNDKPLVFIGTYLNKSTNNQAELFAALQALRWLYKNITEGVITMYLDSKYTLGILSGAFKNINKNQVIVNKINYYINKLVDKGVDIKYEHVPAHVKKTNKHIIRNDEVDKLARYCAMNVKDVFAYGKYPI